MTLKGHLSIPLLVLLLVVSGCGSKFGERFTNDQVRDLVVECEEIRVNRFNTGCSEYMTRVGDLIRANPGVLDLECLDGLMRRQFFNTNMGGDPSGCIQAD